MKRVAKIGLLLLGLATAAFAYVFAEALVEVFVDINDRIDRCDDETSGRYIADDAERAATCGRRR